MSLRKIVLYSILSCALVQSKAQDNCSKPLLVLKEIIKKNIPFDGDAYVNQLSEYYIIDIKLTPGRDSILNIGYFQKNHSSHFHCIDSVIRKITETWKPEKCNYDRILVPVFLLFSSADELYDYPIEFTLKNSRDNAGKNVYLSDTIVINILSRVKKK